MDLEERVAALEATVARLLADRGTDRPEATPATDSEFWFLEELEQRQPEGGVAFAGSVEVPDLGPARWQYGMTTEGLVASEWSACATQLDALAHPVRLTLLQLIHSGVRSTAELAARDELGTTGQLHHHLRALLNAGWLVSTARGHYQIPVTRVIPLLVILLAARPT